MMSRPCPSRATATRTPPVKPPSKAMNWYLKAPVEESYTSTSGRPPGPAPTAKTPGAGAAKGVDAPSGVPVGVAPATGVAADARADVPANGPVDVPVDVGVVAVAAVFSGSWPILLAVC